MAIKGNLESAEVKPKNFEELQDALDLKYENGHTHTESDITDMDKYTQAEVDALLSGLAAAGHDHFVAPPSSAADTGTKGQWSYNAGFLYKCVDTDSWVRWAVMTSW